MLSLPQHIERLLPAIREGYPRARNIAFEWLDNGDMIAIRACSNSDNALIWIVGRSDEWRALTKEAISKGLSCELLRNSSLVALRISHGQLTQDQAVQAFMGAGFGAEWWPADGESDSRQSSVGTSRSRRGSHSSRPS